MKGKTSWKKVAKVLFFISSVRNLSDELSLVIGSMRWYLKYNNSFSTKLKYLIKLVVSVLLRSFLGKTSLVIADHSKLQKPTSICNALEKQKHRVD